MPRRIWWVFGSVLSVSVVGASALAALQFAPFKPVFDKFAWALPIDAWGPGQAYRCTGGTCGREVRLYARTKSGFCNCFAGVADDNEIDRIGDVDLYGDDFRGLAPGAVTGLGAMAGRARQFEVIVGPGTKRRVLSIVVASDCKAVVATLVSETEIAPAVEQAARDLLGKAPFQNWVAAQ